MSIEMLMKPDGEVPRDINDNDVKHRMEKSVERKPTLVIPEPKRLSPLSLVPDVRHEKKSPISPSMVSEVPGFPHIPWQPPFYPALSSAFQYLPYRLPGLPFPPLPEHLAFPSFLEHLRPNSSYGALYNQLQFPHALSQFHLPLRQDKLISFEKRSYENDVNLMKSVYESGTVVPVGNKSEIEALKSPRDSVKGIENNEKKPSIIEPTKYQCSSCQKNYSTFNGLSKHKQFHCTQDTKKEFTCKYCDKTYVSLGALKMHIRTHTLPCKCKICGKAFSRPWLLQGHYRTHTGEKPFSCVHCLRAFADRSNLRAHLQTHSDVKKYSCKTCSKTFSRMSLLVKHEESCRNSMDI